MKDHYHTKKLRILVGSRADATSFYVSESTLQWLGIRLGDVIRINAINNSNHAIGCLLRKNLNFGEIEINKCIADTLEIYEDQEVDVNLIEPGHLVSIKLLPQTDKSLDTKFVLNQVVQPFFGKNYRAVRRGGLLDIKHKNQIYRFKILITNPFDEGVVLPHTKIELV